MNGWAAGVSPQWQRKTSARERRRGHVADAPGPPFPLGRGRATFCIRAAIPPTAYLIQTSTLITYYLPRLPPPLSQISISFDPG